MFEGLRASWKIYVDAIMHPMDMETQEWNGMYFWVLSRGYIWFLVMLLLAQKRLGLFAVGIMLLWGYLVRHFPDRTFTLYKGTAIFAGMLFLALLIYQI